MLVEENRALDLVAECDENINRVEVNTFASYDEGVRDALLWVFEGGPKLYIGREK